MSRTLRIAALSAFCQLLACIASAMVTIETVPVGDVGNPNDPATGNLYGGVNYGYSIGKYEVTFGQYADFLNAVAKADTMGLWSIGYTLPTQYPQIIRSGSPGSYTYTVSGSPNQPMAGVGVGVAFRFINWLDNGQPTTGVEDASTTEDGAYNLVGANPTGGSYMSVTRNPNAKWVLPSESEWYKAAYYQPAAKGGDSDGYWAYPMRTNSAPYSAMPPGTSAPDPTKVGNFYKNDFLSNGYDDGYAATASSTLTVNQQYLTDVGSYPLASSYYGTFDQGGNVYELNEGFVVRSFGTFRGDAVAMHLLQLE